MTVNLTGCTPREVITLLAWYVTDLEARSMKSNSGFEIAKGGVWECKEQEAHKCSRILFVDDAMPVGEKSIKHPDIRRNHVHLRIGDESSFQPKEQSNSHFGLTRHQGGLKDNDRFIVSLLLIQDTVFSPIEEHSLVNGHHFG